MKKTFALVLILCTMLALAACGKTNDQEPVTEPPQQEPAAAAMTDGIYQMDDPDINLLTYVRFNTDGTFYGFYFEGGVVEAGTYEVLEKEMTYYCDGGADNDLQTEEDNGTATASQVVALTAYGAGTVQEVAFVDDALVDMTVGNMSEHKTLVHNAAYEYDPAKEIAIAIEVLYADNNEGSSLTLYHNKTFVDYTGDVGIEGTWELADGGYTLTGEDGTTALLTKTDSGADYQRDGETVTLASEIQSGRAVTSTLCAMEIIPDGLPMPVDFYIDCYGEGTCEAYIYVAAVDSNVAVDTGTFNGEVFAFDNAGEITGETNEDGTFALHYQANVTIDFQGTQMPIVIDTSATGPVPTLSTKEVVLSLTAEQIVPDGLPMPVDLFIDCYEDGSCDAYIYVAQVDANLPVDSGTYTMDPALYSFAFAFEKAGEVEGVPDYASATSTSLNISAAYAVSTTVDFQGNEMPITIDAAAEGVYSIA